MMQLSVLVLSVMAAALVPAGLAPDPAPVVPCLGMDKEQTKTCIKREVERLVLTLPPLPEQAGPPLWLCDSPVCRERQGIGCILPAPSPAAIKVRLKRRG